MFHFISLNKRLLHFKILLAGTWMLQRGNKFADCLSRLADSAMHRGVILRHLEIFGFRTAILEFLSDHIGRMRVQSESRCDRCTKKRYQTDGPEVTFHE